MKLPRILKEDYDKEIVQGIEKIPKKCGRSIINIKNIKFHSINLATESKTNTLIIIQHLVTISIFLHL